MLRQINKKDALAVLGEYANPLGSRKRKTLQILERQARAACNMRSTFPTHREAGRLLESMDAADVFARPVHRHCGGRVGVYS